MKKRSFFTIISGISVAIGSLFLGSCQSGSSTSDAPEDPVLAEGKRLAQQYCSTCHLPVDPDALDKETWTRQVLPAMALRLGLEVWQGNHYYQPANAQISQADWIKLVNYYEKLAPEKPKTARVPEPPVEDWAIFTLKKPKTVSPETATTTLVAIDAANGSIYSGNSTDNGLYRWDKNLNATLVSTLPSPAVHLNFAAPSQAVVTCIGDMKAIDVPKGAVLTLSLDGQKPPEPLAANLVRPVQTTAGDFNHDGLTDWIVCGFGHLTGGLYLLKQGPDHQFERISIRDVPGATQALTGDFNHDGWLDAMVLFAHADEGIWLFLNDRKGGFTEKNLLRFPPVYGSTHFQLADFNRDGQLDILYTSGDNGDYSKILKPFHGVYLFLNQGNFRYQQAWFYPINGCTKAVAADFDGDGDLDLTTIAFFADLKNKPAETFLYFEQDKPLHFRPHAVPVSAYGRWICLDVADCDRDGDPDVVLGNYSQGFINQPDLKPAWNPHLPLIVLENKTR
ncbi:VCBS repeat-containing protein [Larkinella knui]|uniref:VCBS repeat-containing protein n=1 Tax=Larkinella knui TaxID=2025310 RepID=A0A3P1CHR5_9BACT|nr:FG-GAP-like repeat-containing protein [Larkinella knui]RRB12817.1 VCBS repeat-containing protein [Larkinella knui]